MTAIRLLKRAKKRHEEDKARQNPDTSTAPPVSTRERGLSMPLSALTGDHPDSPTASVKSIGGGSSMLSFSQTSAMYKRVGSRRGPGSTLGLKELVDPDYRLSTVLEKLASDRVLSVLESFVNSAEQESATPRGMKQGPISFPILQSRMPDRMFPMGVDMLATGAPGSHSHRHRA
ncbi:unnamed protein product [Ostreobium quekettii]|uniref:Uncharacterized protein n=1 Tax=Ostreobium quekettii TaxID=121088 RepID=A0A8S1J9B5_9CHLO|nr:unnamed protein product [Ostreobium quekettii]